MWFDLRTERQLLWKCPSDAFTAFLAAFKSSRPLWDPSGTDTKGRAQQERAQNRCSGFLWSVWSWNSPGWAPPVSWDVPGMYLELPCLPHGWDRLLCSLTPKQQAGSGSQSRIQHSLKFTHPERKHVDFMLLSRTLDRIRCSLKHQCSTNTPFTLM